MLSAIIRREQTNENSEGVEGLGTIYYLSLIKDSSLNSYLCTWFSDWKI